MSDDRIWGVDLPGATAQQVEQVAAYAANELGVVGAGALSPDYYLVVGLDVASAACIRKALTERLRSGGVPDDESYVSTGLIEMVDEWLATNPKQTG